MLLNSRLPLSKHHVFRFCTVSPSKPDNGSKKYANSVILPSTEMPLKIKGKKLIERDAEIGKVACFDSFYKWQRDLNAPEFILHDGPPYANGSVHMGHALNKILKDAINRRKLLEGKKVNFIPGWDCHGLPIELKALEKNKNLHEPLKIRSAAREFAKKTIAEQMEVFKSWGVFGDWENAYTTFSEDYVKNQMRQFLQLYAKKLVYRDLKPVFWSPSSRTALAEAELEYTNHTSNSIILKMYLTNLPDFIKDCSESFPVFALIWTTTPWSVPSNQAICYNPNVSYCLIRPNDKDEIYLVATELVQKLQQELQMSLKIVKTLDGKSLNGLSYLHPFDRNLSLPFLPGLHVNLEKGTGLVHTAPAHGPDDFLVALNNKMEIKSLVGEDGRYTDEAGENLEKMSVLNNGEEKVLQILSGDILHHSKYSHSYPYDWRTKKPVIIRASQQWFIDTNSLKEKALELLKSNVKILPEKYSQVNGEAFESFLKKRPYWCISRQRVWGVPIPVVYDKSGAHYVSENIVDNCCDLIDKHGTDFWWSLPKQKIVPDDFLRKNGLNANDLSLGKDIFDIWVDSGLSWSNALNGSKADMYLEGVDQFSGWFQSSLLLSAAIQSETPYKSIYVHGFVLDEAGRKMSKSLGNVVKPQDIVRGKKPENALGIDVLRWWAVCHASGSSAKALRQNVLQSCADEVQKIRNVLRYAVSVCDGPEDGQINYESLNLIDKYILHLLYEMNEQVKSLYDSCQFPKIGTLVIHLVTNPLSALYYLAVKDRLYCQPADSEDRKGAKYVLKQILDVVTRIIAPIVPHLAEELHLYSKFKVAETFFKIPQKDLPKEWFQPDLAERTEMVLEIKRDANRIQNNLVDSRVEIETSNSIYSNLKMFQEDDISTCSELTDIFQASEVILMNNSLRERYKVQVYKSDFFMCRRCRKFNALDYELCTRCRNVLGQ